MGHCDKSRLFGDITERPAGCKAVQRKEAEKGDREEERERERENGREGREERREEGYG